MSDPFDLVCSRVPGLRMHGPDRARGSGLCHGGSNCSTLSIGRGNNGAVLLRCWQGCEVEQIVSALGLTMEDLFPTRAGAAPPLKRRGMLSKGQALEILSRDAMLVAVAAGNLAHGAELTVDDRARLMKAAGYIQAIALEAHV